MEGFLQVFGDMTGRGPSGLKESQEPMQVNPYQTPALYPHETISFNNPHQLLDAVPSGVDGTQPLVQPVMTFDNKDQSMKNCTPNSQCPNGRARRIRVTVEKSTEQIWQRIRWTDEMVKLLITAVCYFSEAASSESPESETGQLVGPTKGKWRYISNTLAERGYIVSPQQCEDKFNELNKKYKRLNDLLGRSVSSGVVENPEIIESMDVPEEAKEEVRKISSCRHLFYREMCSYHDRNRNSIPRDANLEKSVRSCFRKDKMKYGSRNLILGARAKRRKGPFDLINVVPRDEISYSLLLEEKKLQLRDEMLELEKGRFEWLKICKQEDWELHKMKIENEVMRLENEHLAFQLKCRERGDTRD